MNFFKYLYYEYIAQSKFEVHPKLLKRLYQNKKPPVNLVRGYFICLEYMDYDSYEEAVKSLATKYSVTRERIRNITFKYYIIWRAL